MSWDVLGVLLLLYTVVTTPLRLGFDIDDDCWTGVWTFEFAIDAYFVSDLILNFFTGPYLEDYEKNPIKNAKTCKAIGRQYLRSWFFVDLISSVPIDVFMTLAISGWGVAAGG